MKGIMLRAGIILAGTLGYVAVGIALAGAG
jgi:hypothetical protein